MLGDFSAPAEPFGFAADILCRRMSDLFQQTLPEGALSSE
jgi:hypothetical protein